jgi:ABC-type uncharacterized transport system auxiliary subunit
MKNIIAIMALMAVLSGCKDPAPKVDEMQLKRDACWATLIAFCEKGEECVGQPAAECLAALKAERVCTHEIKSSVKDILTCETDMRLTDCETPPESCLTLE